MFSHIKELFTRPSGYSIARSVRLRSSASAYFNRTLTTPTDGKKWTYSFWIKRGSLTTNQPVLTAYTDANNQATLYHTTGNKLYWLSTTGGSTYTQFRTDALYRDPSAWYHFVVVFDSTNATSTDRIKMYVNGTSLTCEAGQYIAPALNTTAFVNTAIGHRIGNDQNLGIYLDGYLTEINFIDGQALTPSSFGETDSITGVWKAKKYAGTYGTNGFYLNFSDNSAATATTIGKDYSGNGNNWTPNNISVTSGSTYDSMVDSPTNNFAVLSPLDSFITGGVTISAANLTVGLDRSTYNCWARATFPLPASDTWYFEVVQTAQVAAATIGVGVISTDTLRNAEIGTTSTWHRAFILTNGNKYTASANTPTSSAYGSAVGLNVVVGVAVNMNTGRIWFRNASGWFNSGDPTNSTDANAAFSDLISSGKTWLPFIFASNDAVTTSSINLGQRPFTYTPPTGFVALNTYNLPASTIKNGAAYMAATTYTGTGSSQTIANTVNSISFQPDFVWMKGRSGATDHALYDSVRGTTIDLVSNSTAAETTQSTGLTAFGSTGFTIGALAKVNTNAATYIGWQWKAGGASSSNTNGSITSQVNAGATQGFSVVTYTANNTAGATIGHGLGVAPSFIIVKCRNNANSWNCYHRSLGNTQGIDLNSTGAASSSSLYWNNTSPTSTVFSVSTYTNNSTFNYVAYCFAAVAGYSAFGSYTGNGSADGPFVYTGFRPRFVMIKQATVSSRDWIILDTSRNTYNVADLQLLPNTSEAENTTFFSSTAYLDILSNGFKVRNSSVRNNESTATYIYAAFAENPTKYALAR